MVIKRHIKGIAFVLLILSIAWIVMAAAPTITINAPADGSNVTVNYVNVSVTTGGTTGIVLLNWDGGANETMQGSGNSFFLNKTGLTNKLYTFIVYANDTTPDNWTASQMMRVTVNVPAPPPLIITHEPPTPVNSILGAPQAFNVTVDQMANVSWKINGVEVQLNLSVPVGTKAEYINTTAGLGSYMVTATASTDNGSSSPQVWVWSVTPPTGPPPVSGITATRGTTWINWTWINPTTGNFNYTIVRVNGTFQTNTSDNFFNYTQFSLGTSNTISLQTVDTAGNVNSTIVINQVNTLNTLTGTNVSVLLPNGVAVIFSQVNGEGNTSAIPSSTNLGGTHGFLKIGSYYNIMSDANSSGNITIELSYIPAGFNESTAKLFHWTGTSWDDVTTFPDIVNHKVRGNVTSLSPFVAGVPPDPAIIKVSPTATNVETIGTQSATFQAKSDQVANISWKLDGTQVSDISIPAGAISNYTNTAPAAGSHNVTVTATNITTGASNTTFWNWTVRPKTFATGNRVWDANKDMSTTYTWNPMSFYAFYYDVDSNVGNESLQIKLADKNDRTIERGTLTYSTTPDTVQFQHKDWKSYSVIGFMAKKYFAGYTASTSADITDGKSVSPLSYNQLHEVLMDDNTQKAVYAGSTLTLGDGYVLKVADVGTGRVVMLNLLKDGGTVDTGFVEAGKTYKYVKRVGAANDLPIIAVNVASVFQGTEANAAFIKGIFQISESYISLNSGNRYGIMEITGASVSGINMENRDTFTLSQGATIDVMGDVKFIVADSSVLRFAPMVKRSGTYEVRGTIVQNNDTFPFEWTPMNFEGFYYNLNEDIGTEKLSIINRSGTNVIKGNLVYSTTPQAVSFKYSSLGKYNVIGFMADKYFAGYIGCPTCITTKDINTMSYSQLHKVLIDDDTQRVVYAGSTLTLNDGYVLKIKDVNMGAGSAEVWLSLLKDGNEVDSTVTAANEVYTYGPPKAGVINDLPIIAVRVQNIFRGREATAAFMKGIFQISENPTRINNGDNYGIMEIASINSNEIKMTNPSSFTLSSGSTIDVMGNIKFKVADSSDVRFYPFIIANGTNISENQLSISVPDSSMVRDTITIKVTSGSGTPVENAEVSFDGSVIGNTNSTGMLDYMLTRSGQHTITATKLGYEKATKTIQIAEFRDISLKFELPAIIDQGIPAAIKVISNGTAIPGANVTFNGAGIGLTDSSGILTYTFSVSGTHNLGASKQGYISVVREITIRAPFTEFKAIDINFTPSVVFMNQNYFVWSNVTNVGTKNGTLPVSLSVNDTAVESQNVTLAPGATQEINFTRKMTLPPGNYTVEILGQKKIMEVKEEPFNILLIGGIVTVLGAVVIYLSTTVKGKTALESLTQKFNELVTAGKK